MLKKIWNWFLSLFGGSYKDTIEGFVPKSAAKKGSEFKPNKFELPRAKEPCRFCTSPMFVSIGQIVFTHRRCRTPYRAALRARYAY